MKELIVLYYKEASNYEIYEYIMTMLKKLKDEVGDVYIAHFPTRTEQDEIVSRMKHFVLLFLFTTLSCNPQTRTENKRKISKRIKKFRRRNR